MDEIEVVCRIKKAGPVAVVRSHWEVTAPISCRQQQTLKVGATHKHKGTWRMDLAELGGHRFRVGSAMPWSKACESGARLWLAGLPKVSGYLMRVV